MYTVRETEQRKAQVAELSRLTGLDGFAAVTDFAMGYTWAKLRAERPKETLEPMTIYISRDAESWGAEPTELEVAKLAALTEKVAKEWTRRPVTVEIVDGSEAFTKSLHNDPLADEIAEAAWNRMFS